MTMKISTLLAAATLLVPCLVSGQELSTQVRLNGIKATVEMQKTPSFMADGPKAKQVQKPREWLEIEVEFTPAISSKFPKEYGKVIPKLSFEYYIMVEDKVEKKVKMLTGAVTHVNVMADEVGYSVIYVDPAALTKLDGAPGKFNARDVKDYGVVAKYDGVTCGLFASSKPFWESPSASSAAVPGLILNKSQTPFAMLWTDRYPEIEKSK